MTICRRFPTPLPNCRFNHRYLLFSLSLTFILVASSIYFDSLVDAASEQLDIYFFSEANYIQPNEHFIMYRCDAQMDTHNCGGHADRLKGIMSIYLWSLLTNRSLLIRITRPCNFVNLLEPNEVNWSRHMYFEEDEVSQIYRFSPYTC